MRAHAVAVAVVRCRMTWIYCVRKGRPSKHEPLLGFESNGNDDDEEEEEEKKEMTEERNEKKEEKKRFNQSRKYTKRSTMKVIRDGRYEQFVDEILFHLLTSNDWMTTWNDRMGEFVNRQKSLS